VSGLFCCCLFWGFCSFFSLEFELWASSLP
jgi:hypothetical protein